MTTNVYLGLAGKTALDARSNPASALLAVALVRIDARQTASSRGLGLGGDAASA